MIILKHIRVLRKKGIGKISSLEDISKNNINNIFIYNEQKIYEFIIVFVFIIMSIGGYNTLANLEYKRLLTIYYITGITWKKRNCTIDYKKFYNNCYSNYYFFNIFE